MADQGIKQRPISFSGPQVRAILDGRMIQTRQVVEPQPQPRQGMVNAAYCGHPHLWLVTGSIAEGDKHDWRCPYGELGDQLWVQEPWAVQRAEPCLEHERDWQELAFPTIRYLADGATRRFQGNRSTGDGIYKGPVEKDLAAGRMPRWASRITLEVASVGVERLQDITQDDAAEEGCPGERSLAPGLGYRVTPREQFERLWESLYGAESWSANPWVWVEVFRLLEVRRG